MNKVSRLINFVIPMAGLGMRFQKAGYTVPKWMIEVNGQSLLEMAVGSLPLDIAHKLIFIALRSDAEKFNLKDKLITIYSKCVDVDLILLERPTRGQAETVFHARNQIAEDSSIVIFNIDTKFESSTLRNSLLDDKNDGVLGAFYSAEPRFSFAIVDSGGRVMKTAEKERISSFALTGLYSFKASGDFFAVCDRHIKSKIMTADEFYIAPMYNDLISIGKNFVLDFVDGINILGTPSELDEFVNNYRQPN